jgi:hypothetical protein
VEPWRLTVEPWRLTLEQCRVFWLVIAESHPFDEEADLDRHYV